VHIATARKEERLCENEFLFMACRIDKTSVGKTLRNYLQLGSCAVRDEIDRWDKRHRRIGCKERQSYWIANYQVNMVCFVWPIFKRVWL
jgi:hypothetical protein